LAASAGTADPPAPLFACAERLGGQGTRRWTTVSDRHPRI